MRRGGWSGAKIGRDTHYAFTSRWKEERIREKSEAIAPIAECGTARRTRAATNASANTLPLRPCRRKSSSFFAPVLFLLILLARPCRVYVYPVFNGSLSSFSILFLLWIQFVSLTTRARVRETQPFSVPLKNARSFFFPFFFLFLYVPVYYLFIFLITVFVFFH